MSETWRPIVKLIEEFSDLLALARRSRAGGARKGVDADAVVAAVGRLRDAFLVAAPIDLLALRLHHKGRGGPVARIVPRPQSTQAPSYSDEAKDLAEEQIAGMIDRTGELYLGYPEDLDPDAVARQWREIAGGLAALDIPDSSLARLMAAVREEHRAAPDATPDVPLVHRGRGLTNPGRRRREDRARRSGYEIVATAERPGGEASESPTDQIFFIAGEPAERSVTKVGGLPYRAAGLPWPRAEDGRPMTFLAQFCLAESRDLVGKLPGAVLLIFAEGREAYLPDPYFRDLRFEWHPPGVCDLIAGDSIPESGWKLRPYFGVRHRTDDEHLVGDPEGQTKIGGRPAWIQAYESHQGLFLGELGSRRGVPAPWDRWGDDPTIVRGAGEELSMGDMGCLYFFLRADGTIRWSFQCY